MSEHRNPTAQRIACEVRNMSDAAGQELGYIKSILHAIAVLTNQDAETNKLEIASLANCAHWIADNLESNVDYFGGQILEVSKEVH